MSYLNLNGLQYFFNKYIKPLIQGKQDTIEGAASTITGSNLTENRALVSNGNGKVAVSAVTATELGCLDGVTSGIQEQINALNNNLDTHLGNVRKMYTGSKIVTGTGNTSAVLFTLSELNGLISENLSTSDAAAFVSIFVQNGDANTSGAHFSGVNYQTSGTWLVVAESTISSGSKARINYLVVVR